MDERDLETPLEVEELRAENADLKSQLAAVEAEREQAAKARKWAVGFGMRRALGPDLVDASRAWFHAKTPTDPLPADESGVFAAEILNRLIRVGILGAALAVLPTGMLIWQNVLLQDQGKILQSQVQQQQTQIEQQIKDTRIVRRAQLLETIYTVDCEEPTEGDEAKPICRPKAGKRTVREAVLAFVQVERDAKEKVLLDKAPLFRAELSDAALSGADLIGADL
jgi:hypothetical protein